MLMEIDFFNSVSRNSNERISLLKNKYFGKFPLNSDYLTFGYDYFDNNHIIEGYGGYKYDGRYEASVKKIIKHYGLKKGDRILEIGCAKGYILIEFQKLGFNVIGLDYSKYAVNNCHPDLKDSIFYHDVSEGINYPDNYFDFVLSKDVIPHFEDKKLKYVFKEMFRVLKNQNMFHDIQCGRNKLELEYMKKWDSTHKIIWTVKQWLSFFKEISYSCDYHFKILIESEEIR